MYGLQEHEMRFYSLFKKVYFSLLATSDFFCRHAYAYAHMRIIRHESDMAAYAWPSLVSTPNFGVQGFICKKCNYLFVYLHIRHPGTSFLRSSYNYIFKNIAYVIVYVWPSRT